MKTYHSPQQTVLCGKASEVFAEIKMLAFWEQYRIGTQCYTLDEICLN